jgi:aerobic carbon-monoxide dehydrogenase medium subunit
MKPGAFSYEAPATLQEVLQSLATWNDNAKLIAGGQSLAPMLNMRLARPERLIDINRVNELGGIANRDGRLRIGALVRHDALAKSEMIRSACPMLAHAAETIGHYAIRKRGTIGGSLAHADPAAQLPLVALALDAEMEIHSARGIRMVPARDFFLSIFTTILEPDELLAAIHVALSSPQEGWGFRLFNRRAGDFAIVSVAATLARGADDAVAGLRLAIGGIGPVPVRAEQLVVGDLAKSLSKSLSKDWPARVGALVADAVEIEENERIPVAFRRELVAALTRDALDQALERIAERTS